MSDDRHTILWLPPGALRRNLVGYWPLASGGAVDLKNALYEPRGPYDATNNGSAARASGPSNNLPDSVNLVAASSQYLDIPGFPALPQTSFTVAWWMRAPSAPMASGERVFDVGTAPTLRSWDSIWINSTILAFRVCNDGTTVISCHLSGLTASDWNLFIGEYDFPRSEIRFQAYDRITATPATLAGGASNNSAGLHIGASHTPGHYSDIQVAHLGVWRRLLTAHEKLWLYNNGQGRNLARGT